MRPRAALALAFICAVVATAACRSEASRRPAQSGPLATASGSSTATPAPTPPVGARTFAAGSRLKGLAHLAPGDLPAAVADADVVLPPVGELSCPKGWDPALIDTLRLGFCIPPGSTTWFSSSQRTLDVLVPGDHPAGASAAPNFDSVVFLLRGPRDPGPSTKVCVGGTPVSLPLFGRAVRACRLGGSVLVLTATRSGYLVQLFASTTPDSSGIAGGAASLLATLRDLSAP